MTRKRFDFSEAMDCALGRPRNVAKAALPATTGLSAPDAYALGYNDGSCGYNSREDWVRQQAPEQHAIVRRIAERGHKHAIERCGFANDPVSVKAWSHQVDLWQHLLDELERL